MNITDYFLIAIIVLLLSIDIRIGAIAKRLKERFPTEKEQDYKWSQDDPHGHWAAHKKDKK